MNRWSMTLATLLGLITVHFGAAAQEPQDWKNVAIETLHVAGNVHMLVGIDHDTMVGGNMAVSVGEDGVVLVDTQFAPLADRIIAAVRDLTPGDFRYVINTHGHPDHTNGNARFREMGALVLAHDNVGAESRERPDVAYTGTVTLHVNGEEVEIIPVGPAHTDGDSFVFFKGSNVLHVGDVLMTETYPVIDAERGGSIEGTIKALNLALELVRVAPGFLSGQGNRPGSFPPSPGQEDATDTIIISGHGRLYDEADLVQYRDMVVIIRDRIAHLIDRGLTLGEIKAARPTLGWDARYGADKGEEFIEAVYKELSAS